MNVQELLTKDLLEEESQDSNETLQLLEFMGRNGVALSTEQVKAMMFLHEFGLDDLAMSVNMYRSQMTNKKTYFELISKLTMADRIRGNAKLSHLMKANANPANSALKPEDVQPKALRSSEMR